MDFPGTVVASGSNCILCTIGGDDTHCPEDYNLKMPCILEDNIPDSLALAEEEGRIYDPFCSRDIYPFWIPVFLW